MECSLWKGNYKFIYEFAFRTNIRSAASTISINYFSIVFWVYLIVFIVVFDYTD